MTAHIVVVGAGPAGMCAAVEANNRGCRVTVVDEAARPGGQIYREADPRLAIPGLVPAGEQTRKDAILEAFKRIRPNIDYRAGVVAHALFPGPEVQISDDTRSETLRPGAVIVASGVGERAVPFPGWTLPGVFYAGGLQAMMKSGGVRPGGRVVIAGCGPLPIALAAQLVSQGTQVASVALLTPMSVMVRDPVALWAGREVFREGLAYLNTLRKARVPVLNGYLPVRANGDRRVESLTLAQHHEGRPIPGSEILIDDVDTVGINFGFTANSELVRIAGATVHFDPVQGGWLARCDPQGATSVEGIYVAGDGGGLRGALVAAAEGHIVGAAAAAHALGRPFDSSELDSALETRQRHERFQRAVRRTLDLPSDIWDLATPETIVCRCEGVTRERLDRARADGHRTLDGIKRNTRAGMGWCGGRTCLQAVARLCQVATPDQHTEPMRARPVARPVTLGALAASDQEQTG